MSGKISIRFYEELNDFLPEQRRKVAFEHEFSSAGSIKDVIESLGVPHTEVDLVLINGESVDFTRKIADGDQVSVYPVFESIDIRPIIRLRPEPLRICRFVLDAHLGRLAAYLRLLGFDTLYRNDYRDELLAQISEQENRILLTRDRKLLMRKNVTRGYYVREHLPRRQLVEIVKRFDLHESLNPLTRCMHCNGEIREIDKSVIEQKLLPRTRQYYSEFRQCRDCGKIYWKGSHYQRLLALIDQARQ